MSTNKDLEQAVVEGFAQFGAVVNLQPDEDLAHYTRGKKLKAGEFRALPQGSIVWMTYKEYGEREFRVNGPYRISSDQAYGETWWLSDGSSFGCEICLEGVADDADAIEDMSEGLMTAYVAKRNPK